MFDVMDERPASYLLEMQCIAQKIHLGGTYEKTQANCVRGSAVIP